VRRFALLLAVLLAGLAVVAGPADAAKRKRAPQAPVVTKVSPLRATVGQQLTIRGKHFRPGKGKNGIGFKAAGQPIVFIKSDLSTRRMITVTLSSKLDAVLASGAKQFRLRVLTGRFGKRYTPVKLSPFILPAPGTPATAPPAPAPTLPAEATGTGVPVAECDVNASGGGDQDRDRMADGLERAIGTDPCSADTDRDGVEDGFEYRSAIDLNDDEYRQPNETLPYPGKRPYPNPLDGGDAETDYDGDTLDLDEEYRLWLTSTPAAQRSFADAEPKATPLSYSDGLQFSVSVRCPAAGSQWCSAGDTGRRVPALSAGADPSFQDFFAWAQAAGYAQVKISVRAPWYGHEADRSVFDIRDVNLSGAVSAEEDNPLDRDADGFISDDERDADVDGLSNYAELHGQMLPSYWTTCYTTETPYLRTYQATDAADADTDGDGVRDGADDEDADDIPNLMELSRIAASPYDDRLNGRGVCKPETALTQTDANGNLPLNHPDAYGWVQPFNPCLPLPYSRTCSGVYLGSYAGPTWWALQ
jgi:hypothetical protein